MLRIHFYKLYIIGDILVDENESYIKDNLPKNITNKVEGEQEKN